MPIVPTDKELYMHFSGNSKGIRGTARFFRLSYSTVGAAITRYRKKHCIRI